MYNKAILMGRLARDPELKTTPNGVSVCTFSIAVDRRYQGKDEEKKTDFFNIVAWRQLGEFVCKYFSKGRSILVEGELQNRSYTDKDGITRYITEVNAHSVHFTGEQKDSSPAPQTTGGKASKASTTVDTEEADEEYPF